MISEELCLSAVDTRRAELAAARSEDDYVPWEEVKADLGLR